MKEYYFHRKPLYLGIPEDEYEEEDEDVYYDPYDSYGIHEDDSRIIGGSIVGIYTYQIF